MKSEPQGFPAQSTVIDAQKFLAMSDDERKKFARSILKQLGKEWSESLPKSPHETADGPY